MNLVEMADFLGNFDAATPVSRRDVLKMAAYFAGLSTAGGAMTACGTPPPQDTEKLAPGTVAKATFIPNQDIYTYWLPERRFYKMGSFPPSHLPWDIYPGSFLERVNGSWKIFLPIQKVREKTVYVSAEYVSEITLGDPVGEVPKANNAFIGIGGN